MLSILLLNLSDHINDDDNDRILNSSSSILLSKLSNRSSTVRNKTRNDNNEDCDEYNDDCDDDDYNDDNDNKEDNNRANILIILSKGNSKVKWIYNPLSERIEGGCIHVDRVLILLPRRNLKKEIQECYDDNVLVLLSILLSKHTIGDISMQVLPNHNDLKRNNKNCTDSKENNTYKQ